MTQRWRKGIRIGLTCLLILTSASQAWTQEKKDPQSTYEPRSNPGEGQKYLKQYVGNWEVTKIFYPRTGEPVKMRGECQQHLIHQGRFLQSDFTFHQGETISSGTGIIGFDPASGKFTSIWTDARTTQFSFRQSQDKFDGKQIVLYSKTLEPDEKSPRRSRTVSRLEENGQQLTHKQYTIDAEGKERLIMELQMKKVSK